MCNAEEPVSVYCQHCGSEIFLPMSFLQMIQCYPDDEVDMLELKMEAGLEAEIKEMVGNLPSRCPKCSRSLCGVSSLFTSPQKKEGYLCLDPKCGIM